MGDIAVEFDDGVAIARFDRPACRNAFRRATYAELGAVATRFEREPAWRALVLTGAGQAFCSGQDLDEMTGTQPAAAALDDALTTLQDITRALARAGKPIVCAVNGPAIGFGLEVALVADLRFAVPDAHFRLPELGHGLFHTNGTYHYLPSLVGTGVAADLILTGRRLEAADALAVGLVSRIVEASVLLTEAVDAARRLARLDPCAYAFARRGLRDRTLGLSLENALAFEQSACLELLTRPRTTP